MLLSPFKKPRQNGFTIVEIMIVLAIAGIIMSIVFLAVPQLQRNSRDAQRQGTIESIRTEIETYSANNTGKYPLNYDSTKTACNSTTSGTFADFYCNYVNDTFKHIQYKDDTDPIDKSTSIFPQANAYQPVECSTSAVSVGTNCTGTKPIIGRAQVFIHGKCKGSQAVSADGLYENTPNKITGRSYALVMGLERANTYFCVDNS